MPKIEPRSPSGAAGYNPLNRPEPPPLPAGGFLRGRGVSRPAEQHESRWGRPVGEAALRLAGTQQRQQAELRARDVSVVPSSSERLLPGRRQVSDEHTYERLRPTAQHVYEQIDVHARTPSADPEHGISYSDSAVDNPAYQVGPQPAAGSPRPRSRITSSARRNPRPRSRITSSVRRNPRPRSRTAGRPQGKPGVRNRTTSSLPGNRARRSTSTKTRETPSTNRPRRRAWAV